MLTNIQTQEPGPPMPEAAPLTQVEAWYRDLLDAAPDAMVVVNQAGEIVVFNEQAEKHFGFSRDELLGEQMTRIIPECFTAPFVVDDARCAADVPARPMGGAIERAGRRKDGREFQIEVMLSRLQLAEGVLVTAAIRDISQRKAAAADLVQMEARYRGLLEAAPDAMVVVNPAGGIVLMNLQAEKRFGYSREEAIGMDVTSIIPVGFAERLLADGMRSTQESVEQQIGSGIELIARRRDGTEFPIEIMLSPLVGAEGILVTAAIRDISLRKAADDHLIQMEARYRGLLEAAPDAMVVVNPAGRIVLMNLQAEKRFGYSREEAIGKDVTSIIPVGFAERLLADGMRSTQESVEQQIGSGIELVARRRDGTEFPIEIMLSPLAGEHGILVTAAIRDITERKKADAYLLRKVEELNRSNEELGQFAYIASHDLQEPLRMVTSYTELLSRRYKGKLDSDADEFMAFAVDGAHRMQQLIKDLLTYSRVASDQRRLRETSCQEALTHALRNLRTAIVETNAQITSGPMPRVLADEMQLVQVFQNIIGNGIKYQRHGTPKLHISAARTEMGQWIISIQDNGLGIEPQYFERVFGMFQRLHQRDEFSGTGIGLAVCKKIIEQHGGRIWVTSEVGRGSLFQFTLTDFEETLDPAG